MEGQFHSFVRVFVFVCSSGMGKAFWSKEEQGNIYSGIFIRGIQLLSLFLPNNILQSLWQLSNEDEGNKLWKKTWYYRHQVQEMRNLIFCYHCVPDSTGNETDPTPDFPKLSVRNCHVSANILVHTHIWDSLQKKVSTTVSAGCL